MDIMELGAIGELVGGIAVVASLVFVGLQVRQNTRSVRAAALHQSNQSFAQFNSDIAINSELVEVVRRARDGEPHRNADDLFRFMAIARGAFLRLEDLFHQQLEGFADPDLWRTRRGFYVRVVKSFPAWREWWETERQMFTQDFASDFEQALSEES